MADKPTPGQLYTQAGGDPDRYHALMVEHGHLVLGTPEPLPCGWSPRIKGAPALDSTSEQAGNADG